MAPGFVTARLEGASVTKAVILGTYAVEKRDNQEMYYQWVVLLRSAEDPEEDMSYFIKKVEFNLHETFKEPRRVVDRPPYEIEEIGWGEFEVVAKVFFVDSAEGPVEIKHFLKLRPDVHDPLVDMSKVPVARETYEEILFTSPRMWFHDKLLHSDKPRLPIHKMKPFFLKSSEESEFEHLISVHHFLRYQTSVLQQQISAVDCDYRGLKEQTLKHRDIGH